MEIAIGLFGGLFLPLSEWCGSLYVSLAGRFGLDSVAATTAKFVLSVALIFVPSFLMGGTLPVLSRFILRSLARVESDVGWLYGINSLGAMTGSLVAGFVLIPSFGLNLTVIFAVALNLGVGLAALAWQARGRTIEGYASDKETDAPSFYTRSQVIVAVCGIAFSGAAALIYEIAWIRLLSLVLGSSAYSFSLMLAAFIAGLAAGGFAVSRSWVARFDSYLLFAVAELAAGIAVVLTLPVYERLPFYFAFIADHFVRVPGSFWLYQAIQFLAAFLLMVLPTFFMGMALPLATRVAARSLGTAGREIGQVFAANTTGTIVGAVAAGLFLLPVLGIKRLIEFAVAINLLVGLVALWAAPRWRPIQKISLAGSSLAFFVWYLFFFPAWDHNILSSGMFRQRGTTLGTSYREFKDSRREKILYYRDGANMTVAVLEAGKEHIVLKVNGKVDASTTGDLPTQILSGHLPLLLQPLARQVLVIGMGSGITAGSVLRHSVERVDLVEISPEVVEGSQFFSRFNHEPLRDPRLRLHVEDAKTFLRVPGARYDVIISEPSNPWMAGTANLFSVEFYRDVRRRLAPEGLMVQWFHTYEMSDETLRLVLRTFAGAFEHVSLWSPKAGDLLLIGSQKPPVLDLAKSLERVKDVPVREDLARVGIRSLAAVMSLQVLSDKGVRSAAGKGRLNEDGFPILEYEAPKAFFLGQTAQLLTRRDERRQPIADSPLYLHRHLSDMLGAEETKEIALYHFSNGSLVDLGVARPFLDLWFQQRPNDPEARWLLARIEDRRGNSEGSLKEINSLLESDPNNRDYLDTAARLEFQKYLGQRSFLNYRVPERALAYLDRLAKLTADRKERVYQKIAQVHTLSGNFPSALEYLERAAMTARGSGGPADSIWLEAAETALQLNDSTKALACVKEALVVNPNNGAARRMLQKLSEAAFESAR
ncbi:MAG: fused MFS/spermidine synthase [Candidatus Binatia bacterium]